MTNETFKGLEASLPWLGRCESCDFALFTTTVAPGRYERFRDVKHDGKAYLLSNGAFARCNQGHMPFKLKQIEGTYSESHKCDSRCLNAKGHHCTCSCGGMNHGRGHALTITSGETVEAAPKAPVSPSKPSEFLGEVDKNIRGQVTVERRIAKDDYTIFHFVTAGGHKLVWFAPAFAVPDWQQGQTLTIRGKVKRHEDRGYGKQTVLTYVEEVN